MDIKTVEMYWKAYVVNTLQKLIHFFFFKNSIVSIFRGYFLRPEKSCNSET